MMKTQVLPPTGEALRMAAELIRSGSVVAFPTETVYGLGANALDDAAVDRIFEAKGRPGDNPLIVHIAEKEELASLVRGEPGPMAERMADAFWPGPLTMILPCSPRIAPSVTAGLGTVGVRLPSHPAARDLIRLSGVPIAAPSANRSGRPSPTLAEHVAEDMDGRIPLILDGGPCRVGLESTVVDMTGEIPRILRPGAVTPEQIRSVCGAGEVDPAVMRPLSEGERPRSPGMKYRHYAPRAALTIFTGSPGPVAERICREYDAAVARGRRALILALTGHLPLYGDREVLTMGPDEKGMAEAVFARLREADALNAEVLFSEGTEETGIGLAVMNRLGRAAAFRIERVPDRPEGTGTCGR
ncbi:MAG: threonylcarbamoyl-AMP synthase [Clostridia bacterium]|nr:threonylcarbamoyl-AMP synthase [Clostridia bacterium]